jgi:hypothetical protein
MVENDGAALAIAAGKDICFGKNGENYASEDLCTGQAFERF